MRFAFFVALSLGLPAIVLLADAILDQDVTITNMSPSCADAEKDLERLIEMRYRRGEVSPGASGQPLRGHHGYS